MVCNKWISNNVSYNYRICIIVVIIIQFTNLDILVSISVIKLDSH